MVQFSDEYIAEIYSKQALEWMRKCPAKGRCPAGKLFRYLIAQQSKIERLEAEIKRILEYPDER